MRKKQFITGLVVVLGLALIAVATTFSGVLTASIFWVYQPETPSCLK